MSGLILNGEVIRCRVSLLLELERVLSKVDTFLGVGDLLYTMLLDGNHPDTAPITRRRVPSYDRTNRVRSHFGELYTH